MRRILTIGLLLYIAVCVATAQEVQSQKVPGVITGALSDKSRIQQLEEQVFNLQTGLTQCNVDKSTMQLQARAAELNAKHAALEAELMTVLGGDPKTQDINWATVPPSLKSKDK